MQKIKHLVLGITGGIAAYKAAELTRLLVKNGITVQVVMTDAACHFITPVTMQALSGRNVHTKMWDESTLNGMPHIELSREADAILVAPASADFLAKLVQPCEGLQCVDWQQIALTSCLHKFQKQRPLLFCQSFL